MRDIEWRGPTSQQELTTTTVMREGSTVTHVNTLPQVTSTQAALEESKVKQAALEETHHNQLQEESLKKRDLQKELEDKQQKV